MPIPIGCRQTWLGKTYRFGGGAALLSRFRGVKCMLVSLSTRFTASRPIVCTYIPGPPNCQSAALEAIGEPASNSGRGEPDYGIEA
jgi:hypothetical protein